jgi:hypothetical protein
MIVNCRQSEPTLQDILSDSIINAGHTTDVLESNKDKPCRTRLASGGPL